MRVRGGIGTWVAPVALLAGCATTGEAGAHRAADVDEVIRGLIAADNAGDVDAIASFYAEDAVLLPPAGPAVKGRDAIRARYREGLARFDLQLSLASEERRVLDDWAFDRGVTSGSYVWRDGREPTAFLDKYLMILGRTESGWKVRVLMWSPVGA